MELAPILEMLSLYEQRFPQDIATITKVRDILNGSEHPFSRKSFQRHITCNAVVMNPQNKILLVHHKILDRWMTPGGHIEESDTSMRDAALREMEEETGISRTSVLKGTRWPDNVPIHIDSHRIPENAKKQEPDHMHFDFRFLFRVSDVPLAIQEAEVLAAKWEDINHLEDVIKERVSLCVGGF